MQPRTAIRGPAPALSRRRGATLPEGASLPDGATGRPWEVALAMGLVVGAVGASLLLLLG